MPFEGLLEDSSDCPISKKFYSCKTVEMGGIISDCARELLALESFITGGGTFSAEVIWRRKNADFWWRTFEGAFRGKGLRGGSSELLEMLTWVSAIWSGRVPTFGRWWRCLPFSWSHFLEGRISFERGWSYLRSRWGRSWSLKELNRRMRHFLVRNSGWRDPNKKVRFWCWGRGGWGTWFRRMKFWLVKEGIWESGLQVWS